MSDFVDWMEKNKILAIVLGSAIVLGILYYYGYFSSSSGSGGSSGGGSSGDLTSYYAADAAATNSDAQIQSAQINANRDVNLGTIWSGAQTQQTAIGAGSASDLARVGAGETLGLQSGQTWQNVNAANSEFWLRNQSLAQLDAIAQDAGLSESTKAVLGTAVLQPGGWH